MAPSSPFTPNRHSYLQKLRGFSPLCTSVGWTVIHLRSLFTRVDLCSFCRCVTCRSCFSGGQLHRSTRYDTFFSSTSTQHTETTPLLRSCMDELNRCHITRYDTFFTTQTQTQVTSLSLWFTYTYIGYISAARQGFQRPLFWMPLFVVDDCTSLVW